MSKRFIDNYTASTAGNFENSVLSLETLLDLKKAMDAALTDPVADLMRANGFDPDDGGFLFLPESVRKELPTVPRYVKFSPFVVDPFFLNVKELIFSKAREFIK